MLYECQSNTAAIEPFTPPVVCWAAQGQAGRRFETEQSRRKSGAVASSWAVVVMLAAGRQESGSV